MSTAKAKYLGRHRDRYTGNADLFYEYRGREYTVTDYGWNAYKPLWQQHRAEQEKIDQAIEEESRDAERDAKPMTGPAVDEAFDAFLKYCETGEWEG